MSSLTARRRIVTRRRMMTRRPRRARSVTVADLGGDLNLTQCRAILPMPNGVPGGALEEVVAVQMTLNWCTSTVTGARLPGFVTGRANLSGAIVRRLTTTRGQLLDVVTPSTTANYG